MTAARLERAADLVDHEGGQRFAFDVLGEHDERLAALHDLLENRQQVAHGGDLRTDVEDVRVVEDRFHPLGVGHEVRRDEALVEAHALDELHLHAEGLALFDGDDTVLADAVDGVGDERTDFGIGGGDAGDLGDLLLGLDVLGQVTQRRERSLDGGLDALLQRHRVGAGGDVLQALADHGPRQHRGGGGAVTGDVVGLLGDFLDELGTQLLEWILELDLLGDRYAVVGDGGSTPLLLQHDVAALGAQGDAHCVCELVHTALERPAGLLVERDQLGHLRSECFSVSTLNMRVLIVRPFTLWRQRVHYRPAGAGGPEVVVVMPAYNAAQTLRSTWESIPQGVVDEVLLVDDSSSDATLQEAAALPIRTIALPHNVGYGGNQKTCYLEALRLGADVVVMLHPDGQYDPVLLPDLVAPIVAGDADLVLGSRMLTQGGARAGGMPLYRFVANKALTRSRTHRCARNSPNFTPAIARIRVRFSKRCRSCATPTPSSSTRR